MKYKYNRNMEKKRVKSAKHTQSALKEDSIYRME